MGPGRGRHLAAAFLTLLLLGACASAPVAARGGSGAPEHVVVVSIDGFRPDFYLGDFEAPALKAMVAAGAHARAVESVYPSATYPAHATIVTGVLPAKHGIYANTLWTEQGSSRDWHWYAKALKARTLWQAAQEKGLKVAITYWPSSVGAKAELVLGEIWDPENKETVKRLASAATPGLLTELMFAIGIPQDRIATDRAAVDNFVSRAAAHVFRKHKPNLQLVHLLNCDEVQHKMGPGAPEVAEAVRMQDENIARIRQAIAESGVADRTALLIVGDHGFTTVTRNFGPNTLLRDAGFIEEENGKVKSWKAMIRSSGGSAALYVKDPNDTPRVLESLMAGSKIDGKPVFSIIGRSTLDRLGYNPDAVLALDPAEGWALTERFGPTTPSVAGNHGQLPSRPGLETGFIAEGAGVRPGVTVERMRLVDIAPTVAAMLDLELDDIDGHIRRDILTFRRVTR
jgi:predicted AlkP superfamily pyrophosphatase or phosphodiesterase